MSASAVSFPLETWKAPTAEEFDGIHSIKRAKQVGSVARIISPGGLRRYLAEAVGRGMGRTKQA